MKVIRANVTREDVINFYVAYDCRKKGQARPADLPNWGWDDPKALDANLKQHKLKDGVVAAYRLWWFVELGVADLLDSAIAGHVFKGQSQALSLLVAQGLVDGWVPQGQPEWFDHLKRGDMFPADWAMILRASTVTERPAKWYVEDGTGRALCLLQRVLRHSEPWRVAYGYLGVAVDQRSTFFDTRPELR